MNRTLSTLRTTLASRAGIKHSQAGMTLIEIMVVIAILSILTTAIGVATVQYMQKAKGVMLRVFLHTPDNS